MNTSAGVFFVCKLLQCIAACRLDAGAGLALAALNFNSVKWWRSSRSGVVATV